MNKNVVVLLAGLTLAAAAGWTGSWWGTAPRQAAVSAATRAVPAAPLTPKERTDPLLPQSHGPARHLAYPQERSYGHGLHPGV